MTFTRTDKLKALAIVQVFETSHPFGDFAACVVLDDGAGISYGISQFTHRSGSLASVVDRYLASGGRVGAAAMTACRPALSDTSPASIKRLAANVHFRNALRSAALTREMKTAQEQTAFALYLEPALTLCQKCGFTSPLSLAVIYDSLVHGSFYRVARGVHADRSDEKAWITAYVRRRDGWLASFPRLAVTRYRTRFFLNQIAVSNWDLSLPLFVHGVRLSTSIFESETAVEPIVKPTEQPARPSDPQTTFPMSAAVPQAQPPLAADPSPSIFGRVEAAAASAADRFDRVEDTVNSVVARTDAAKSLWAAVFGTLWQAIWALFGLVAGLPRVVWVTAAVIAGVLMVGYLYRQIELGKIRERRVTPG